MSATLTEVISAFGDVLALFTQPPLSYIVGLAIAGAVVAMIGGLFSR